MTFSEDYIAETHAVLDRLHAFDVERLVDEIARVQAYNGRLFILGVGGSAATASHAVNDFRKICNIQAYAPTDNVAELTARTNDNGWDTTFIDWLRVSRVGADDALLVLSVGGGSRIVSANITRAVDYARMWGAAVLGIVGRDGGHTAQRADVCVVIPTVQKERITPHVEGLASVLLHLIVSHPRLTP